MDSTAPSTDLQSQLFLCQLELTRQQEQLKLATDRLEQFQKAVEKREHEESVLRAELEHRATEKELENEALRHSNLELEVQVQVAQEDGDVREQLGKVVVELNDLKDRNREL